MAKYSKILTINTIEFHNKSLKTELFNIYLRLNLLELNSI